MATKMDDDSAEQGKSELNEFTATAENDFENQKGKANESVANIETTQQQNEQSFNTAKETKDHTTSLRESLEAQESSTTNRIHNKTRAISILEKNETALTNDLAKAQAEYESITANLNNIETQLIVCERQSSKADPNSKEGLSIQIKRAQLLAARENCLKLQKQAYKTQDKCRTKLYRCQNKLSDTRSSLSKLETALKEIKNSLAETRSKEETANTSYNAAEVLHKESTAKRDKEVPEIKEKLKQCESNLNSMKQGSESAKSDYNNAIRFIHEWNKNNGR